MNLRELRVFLTVFDSLNLSVAARTLNVPQPSISRTIRGLEAALDTTLFRRTGRGVVPTEAGRLLRQHAGRIFKELESFDTALNHLRSSESGEVRILLPHYVSGVLVPPFLRRFDQAFPKGHLHVFEEAAALIPQHLGAGKADLGLFYNSSVSAGLAAEPVARERMYLVQQAVAGPCPGTVCLADAARLPIILSSRHTQFRRFVEQRAASEGVRLNVVRELEESQSALAFVRDGEGAAILPLSHFHRERADPLITARPIRGAALTRLILFAFGNRPASLLTRQAAAMLRAVVQAEGAPLGWLSPSGDIPEPI